MDTIQAAQIDTGTLAVITKAEIDQQVATAKQYPRSIKRFVAEALDMVTLSERIAQECIYALPRDGKTIEGPSARMAEIIASAWGNCRAGARVVEEGAEFVTAQGVFHDLERNVMITYEQKRRITDKRGQRYKADMIAVTANAACSIALRNAVFKGIPKAFWSDIYEAARRVIVGDAKTLANRRADALDYLQKFGATEAMVLATLGVDGVEDIGQDELLVLRGIATAIKEGDTTVEQVFSPKGATGPTAVSDMNEKLREQAAARQTAQQQNATSEGSRSAKPKDAPPAENTGMADSEGMSATDDGAADEGVDDTPPITLVSVLRMVDAAESADDLDDAEDATNALKGNEQKTARAAVAEARERLAGGEA